MNVEQEPLLGYGGTFNVIAPIVRSLISKGRTGDVKDLLKKYDARKVSEIKLKHAEGFLAEIRILEAQK